jgi:hypothetical protein
MKQIARVITALAVLAAAAPVLACGFEKQHTTTTTAAPMASPEVAKAEKARPVKVQKAERAKAPTPVKATTTAAN